MILRWRRLRNSVLILAALTALIRPRTEAQFPDPGVPQAPPEGAWAEVVTATPKWLVLQDEKGRQYPVSYRSVEMFLVRWPTSPEQWEEDALVDAYGFDLGNNSVQTDHVDVYQGQSRNLMRPMLLTPALMAMQNNRQVQVNLEFNLFQPLQGVGGGGGLVDARPSWMRAVGPVAGLNPLRLAVPGNNAVSVVPGAGGLTMTLVTHGTPSVLRRGDLVYFVTEEVTPKTLVLTQLVVYKKIPITRFVP